jgi:peptidoglycan/LPS O-acetylase OafA/YrhL
LGDPFARTLRAINSTTFAPLVGMFALGCQNHQEGRANQLMQHKVLLFLNKISYSLYLFHMFPAHFIGERYPDLFRSDDNVINMAVSWIYYIPVIGFCALLEILVERPCNKFARKIT